ncbi:D-alanyl-D-alanine carboxypeptidase precursor [Rhodobacteraceae bacterium THAF1]|uniref:serine hydrolase domain-containing protein n=1 Tax=Palleronia sp. THAF1 TaxID=2587842 RepID=UPI000F419DD6|nr:serine hydrolase [Palleronia sp. THAF1]QFU09784.1 Beta-lactamase [Palleronia sp. THAF1]VDC17313.1 D-alanyl-D-alanine carboxypeptidase precursor [Rhodobacteraceae bacterium THAF1]
MPILTRRFVVASGAAACAAPVFAQTDRWTALADRAAGFDQLHAIAVWRDGEEVLRRRVRGPGLGEIVNVKSVSKTWVAACLGAALDRGEVPSLDATLGDLTPGLIPNDADPVVADITVGHLASMRAGLDRTSGGNYGRWIASGNWVANALGREMVDQPGGRMLYSTGSTHVLGAVLAEVTGQSLLSQMRDRLGAPLGIEIPSWVTDPQGRYLGGNQMGMTIDAMLRFGEMHRTGGTWDGTRVLSGDWIAEATQPRTRSPWSGLGYGYGWFLGEERGADFAVARGYGGQVIAVGPRMVMAITSDPNQPARSQGYFGELMGLVRGGIRLAA